MLSKKDIYVFKATWCGPCKAYAPIVEEARNDLATHNAEVHFIDVDENQELAEQYGVRGVPTTVIVKDGETLQTLVGRQTKEALLAAVLS